MRSLKNVGLALIWLAALVVCAGGNCEMEDIRFVIPGGYGGYGGGGYYTQPVYYYDPYPVYYDYGYYDCGYYYCY